MQTTVWAHLHIFLDCILFSLFAFDYVNNLNTFVWIALYIFEEKFAVSTIMCNKVVSDQAAFKKWTCSSTVGKGRV